MAAMPGAEEQARLLEDALGVVRQQASMMRRCLETPGKLMDALKCCSTLVSELRTSSLSPKQYYELYMSVFDALRHLSVHLRDSHPVNHLADLYELVQYAGNIVPRLYLMITVGTVYMGIEDAPVKEIMKDMMEMTRGVQQPTRGLFLRYYLIGQARDHMPTGSGEGQEGNLQDSISFVLTNFVEMNKLWVRLQHQGHSREREQRTRERQELQLLVGSNLVRLSQLVDLEAYKTVILQPLLEQVVQCRDVLAQEYLLEVITQVFPDEYHLHTLDQLLSATARLHPHVNVKTIVIGLMDRLSAYAAREAETRTPEDKAKAEEEATVRLMEQLKVSKTPQTDEPKPDGEAGEADDADQPNGDKSRQTAVEQVNGDHAAPKGIPANVKLFEIFHEQVMNVINAQRLPIQDITALLVSLANLALNVYPDRLDYLDQVFSYANEKTKQHANSADLHSQISQTHILVLLMSPIKAYTSMFTAVALPNFIPLLRSQSYPTRRSLAGEIAQSLIRNRTRISTEANLESVLEILKVLVKEGLQQPGYAGGPIRRGQETDETIEEQGWLARIVHLIHSPDNDTQFKLLQMVRRYYSDGNDRIKFTTPAICNSSLSLARRIKISAPSNTQTLQALFKFTHALITTLYTRPSTSTSSTASTTAELSLRLFLAAGSVADQCSVTPASPPTKAGATPDSSSKDSTTSRTDGDNEDDSNPTTANFEDISYEFFAQAFTVYEESISDSRAQFQAVCCIASALHGTRGFSRENYDTLITKCALHGSKLLKKPDQCRAVCAASHLWWGTEVRGREGESDAEAADGQKTPLYRDGKRVLECLQRALRVADACMDAAVSVELFVEILNQYVYYFEQENEAVTTKYINGLIELIHSNASSSGQDAGVQASGSMEQPRKHFQRTLQYIKSREYEGVVTEAKG